MLEEEKTEGVMKNWQPKDTETLDTQDKTQHRKSIKKTGPREGNEYLMICQIILLK